MERSSRRRPPPTTTEAMTERNADRPTRRAALRSLSRRQLLAGGATAATVGLAGCSASPGLNRLNPFWDPPIEMKVVAAAGEESDVTCRLPAEAVERHPVLQDAMEELADAEPRTKVTRGLTTDEGRAISDTFTEQCETAGGLYRYEGNWYLVGLTFEAQGDHQDYHDDGHDHGNGTATGTETSA